MYINVLCLTFVHRPLIKLGISWRKDGVLVKSGLSDFNRRLTILSPLVSDSGLYECEAVLRSSSVPSVSAGAYLHVLGNYTHTVRMWAGVCVCVFRCVCVTSEKYNGFTQGQYWLPTVNIIFSFSSLNDFRNCI